LSLVLIRFTICTKASQFVETEEEETAMGTETETSKGFGFSAFLHVSLLG